MWGNVSSNVLKKRFRFIWLGGELYTTCFCFPPFILDRIAMDNEYYKMNFNNPKYKDEIISVYFTPIKEYELINVKEKGKRYWWKFLGLIPIFPYVAKKNKYICDLTMTKRSFKKIVSMLYLHDSREFFEDESQEKIFIKALVEANYYNKSGNYRYSRKRWFTNNESAKKYYDGLIKEAKYTD